LEKIFLGKNIPRKKHSMEAKFIGKKYLGMTFLGINFLVALYSLRPSP
jgi:hypothetical protein